jgi:hypothetical protein
VTRGTLGWAVAALLVGTGCTVAHPRSDPAKLEKVAVSESEVKQVFSRYRTVRNAAIRLLDPKPLSIIERGSVLAIDSGSFEVAQKLAESRSGVGRIDVVKVVTATFTGYPLWFYAVVRDGRARVDRVQIFERETPVDAWQLVESPEVKLGADLPVLRQSASQASLLVAGDDARGMAMSPNAAAKAYAAAIPRAGTPAAAAVESDNFIEQMRSTAQKNGSLPGAVFSQSWQALPVTFALRTRDGGALVFVDLQRVDTYRVRGKLQVSFPEGSPQAALLSGAIRGTGSLTYLHEVLLRIPPGSGRPVALGQWGGVVSVARP